MLLPCQPVLAGILRNLTILLQHWTVCIRLFGKCGPICINCSHYDQYTYWHLSLYVIIYVTWYAGHLPEPTRIRFWQLSVYQIMWLFVYILNIYQTCPVKPCLHDTTLCTIGCINSTCLIHATQHPTVHIVFTKLTASCLLCWCRKCPNVRWAQSRNTLLLFIDVKDAHEMGDMFFTTDTAVSFRSADTLLSALLTTVLVGGLA